MTALPPAVTLRPISAETVRDVTRLRVRADQECFVASNAVSLAQALFAKEAWYRAIYAGETMAGFVMLHDESLRDPAPAKPAIEIWRFMIGDAFQGQGIGQEALRRIIEHVRSRGIFTELGLSYVPQPGSAEPLYRRFGFKPTGEVHGGEVVMSLSLQPASLAVP